MAKLILLRHGQSVWNQLNLFTGWVDVPLSSEGIAESLKAGKRIAHLPIDVIFTSSLMRAQMTAMLAMTQHEGGKIPCIHHPREGNLEKWGHIYNPEAEATCIPVTLAWQLNERMYGKLQGLNKQETIEKYGEAQVKIWRRSFDVAPPEGESLLNTTERAIPYFKEKIIPLLKANKSVFIAAHGNSLRGIVMYIEKLSKEQVLHLEIATGDPILYDYQEGCFKKEMIT